VLFRSDLSELDGKVFLVRGMGSFEGSGAKNKLGFLSGSIAAEFSDFSPNPKVEDVRKGIELYRKIEPDTIISVGGGSVMDMGKLIRGLAYTESPEECIKGNATAEVGARFVKHIAVPTTSGSGSEATHFAVVYVDGNKYSFAGESVLPDATVLDPSLTYSMSPKLTAVTGMDALSQAIESLWSVNATDVSSSYARAAVPIIMESLEGAFRRPNSGNRSAMMDSANYAGMAINISKTTACHALSYYMTSNFDIPHGHAVALTLGEVMEYNEGSYYDEILYNVMGVNSASEGKDKINALMDKIGLERKLSRLGIGVKDIDEIIGSVNLQRLKNNPKKVSEEDLRGILGRVF